MDKFNNDFNRETLLKIRESKQKILTRNVRKKFYDSVIKDNHNGLRSSRLKFPKNLSREYRINICDELLVKFHKIEVIFDYKNSNENIHHKMFYGVK